MWIQYLLTNQQDRYNINLLTNQQEFNLYFMEEIMLEKIKQILVDTANVDAEKVTKEATLKDDLGIDSLDSVEMVLELENQFDIKLEENEIEGLVTVGDVIDLVSAKVM